MKYSWVESFSHTHTSDGWPSNALKGVAEGQTDKAILVVGYVEVFRYQSLAILTCQHAWLYICHCRVWTPCVGYSSNHCFAYLVTLLSIVSCTVLQCTRLHKTDNDFQQYKSCASHVLQHMALASIQFPALKLYFKAVKFLASGRTKPFSASYSIWAFFADKVRFAHQTQVCMCTKGAHHFLVWSRAISFCTFVSECWRG